MKIDGYTRLAAVVAHPIKHSMSPFIHNFAFDATGENGVYVAWDIQAKDLPETLENIRRYNMYGINLSMPYKQAVLPLLDEVTPAATLIGAVNTVVLEEGRLIGYNTDGKGFFASLPNFDIQGQHMVILGSGGAATAIICQALLDGVKEITVFDKPHHLEGTKKRMKGFADQFSTVISVYSLENQEDIQHSLTHAQLLVQATAMGMDGQSLPFSNTVQLPNNVLVADVIYQPFETPFLKWARAQGCQAVNGLGMLLYQAAAAFELWTGRSMPTAQLNQLLTQQIEEKEKGK